MGNPKAFLTILRKEAGYRPVSERIYDFGEVEQTLNREDRKLQASRCMDCGVPFCHWACPLGNRMPEWQDLVYKEKWQEAIDLLHETNNFPDFTGRICPALCEKSCVLALNDSAVTIRENEAAVTEIGFQEGMIKAQPPKTRTGQKVAVIGSGPAGLAAAQQLNRKGHSVTVFEKENAPGGLLRYGIPNFKLNKNVIDRRLALLKEEGIAFKTNTEIGKDITGKELLKKFDAVCIAVGAGQPRDLNAEGRDLKGIHFAMDYLSMQNKLITHENVPEKELISAKDKHVLVIGGGDTGSDCVGTAIRQGAKKVTQIEIMPKPPVGKNPATPWPYYPDVLKTSGSHEEGCERFWSLSTVKFTASSSPSLSQPLQRKEERGGDAKPSKASTAKEIYITNKSKSTPPSSEGLGEAAVGAVLVEEVEWINDNGRMCMKPTGKTKSIKADLVFLSMGFVHPVHEGLLDELGVKYDARGNVAVNNENKCSINKTFAAGDAASGASLVVRAIASGRKAAEEIHRTIIQNP